MCIQAQQCAFMGMTDRQAWRKKTDLVPCEPDTVASVGLDHQNPMRPSTVYLSLFPAAPSVSNLFSGGVWEKRDVHIFVFWLLLLCVMCSRCSVSTEFDTSRRGKKCNFPSPT